MQQGQLLDYRGYKIFYSKAKEYHICQEKEGILDILNNSVRLHLADAKKLIDDIWEEKREEMIENEVNTLLESVQSVG